MNTSHEVNEIITSSVVTSHGRIQSYKVGNGKQAILFLHGAGSDSALLSWKEILHQLPADFTG